MNNDNDYYTICSTNTDLCVALLELEKSVKKLLIEGWKLQGGVSTVYNSDNKEYSVIQALARWNYSAKQ